jgi:hypothetical protein
LEQIAFTYALFMQELFTTRFVASKDGLAIMGAGIAILLILEIEKRGAPGIARDRHQRRHQFDPDQHSVLCRY